MWQKVLPQQQYSQTQDTCVWQASPQEVFYATFPCGPMTTIEEINPNLNVRARGGREEEGGSGQLQEEG